ncbi:glutathione S-transferase family protein [Thiohalorhabdus sp.]|uniref:glutathione S-transferase family protein n=1 Tax=Thiohalorhabdus sp. TaxID=3094134 RepID=UPI002FC32384
MKLDLISFPICPFVQRSVITLLEKGAAYEVTYIDLANKPEWFLALSPLGKVPVLRVDDEHVIFESAVINEFVNEVTPGDFHPQDPVAKAHDRAWIAFAETLLFDQYRLMMAEDANTFEAAWHDTEPRLARVDAAVAGPLWRGEAFSLVDAAVAPLLQRYEVVDRITALPDYADFTNLRGWWTALRERPAVAGSVPNDFEDQVHNYFREKDSHFGRQC